jgi:thiamine biosynthesis lipoprotein
MKKIGLLYGILILVITGCAQPSTTSTTPPASNLEHSRIEILMNAPIHIRIFDIECNGTDTDDERCDLLDDAFDLIFDLERRWTVNDVGGEVEQINEMAGIAPVMVDKDTFYLIEQAIYYSIYSDRLFNATIGPLTSMWNISMEGARRPSDEEIAEILPLLDPTRVVLDHEASTVFLEEEGMRLDLGAIAKGYMADLVAALLINNGIDRGLLIVGGEVLAIGGRRDGSPFRVGIHAPFPEAHSGDLVGTIPTYNQAVVTSGTYNRYLAHQDTRTIYHHIFDSITGLPFDSDIVSMTIVADTGLLGEVYSTIVFALGIEAGMAYVEAHPSIEAMFISKDNGIYLSSGLQDAFELILDEEFEVRTP